MSICENLDEYGSKPTNPLSWEIALDKLALAVQREAVRAHIMVREAKNREEPNEEIEPLERESVLYQDFIRAINKVFGTKYMDMAGSLENRFEMPYKEE